MGFGLVGILGVVVLILALGAAEAGRQKGGSPVLSFKGPEGPVVVGDEISVTVFLSDVVGLYAAQLELGFDPAVLQVVDENGGLPGVQIMPGACPQPDFVLVNSADNVTGTVDYSTTQLNPTPPISGDCVVLVMRFQTQQAATTTLSFEGAILSDQNGGTIPAAKVDLALVILPPEPTADFAASPTMGFAPLTVTFANLSTGIFHSCLWDFGDGASSADCVDPAHTYLSSGSYSVTLTVTGPGGSGSYSVPDYIQVSAVLDDAFLYLPAVLR